MKAYRHVGRFSQAVLLASLYTGGDGDRQRLCLGPLEELQWHWHHATHKSFMGLLEKLRKGHDDIAILEKSCSLLCSLSIVSNTTWIEESEEDF